ncbi:MAG: adenosylmethionine decarboxylase, partial [Rhodospirillaceae bacterium]
AEVRSVQIAVDNAADGHHDNKDHFIIEDGLCFAGRHLILDLYEAEGLDDISRIERAMRKAVDVSGATLLHIHLHHFSPNGGVSGVAVLAESHISIHTWPERDYAALDIFMCGDAKPHRAVPVFRDAFKAGRHALSEHKRGSL